MTSFYLATLGCKLNQAEAEAWGREIEAAGHRLTDDPAQADWALLNTCAVTHVAARKSRQAIRQLHRANPALRLAVTGCYAAISATDLVAMEGVALVVGNADKDAILQRILVSEPMDAAGSFQVVALGPHHLSIGRTRALVKIQDGCDNRCTYCIVWVARGPQRSRPPDAVLDEIRTRLSEGYREVVLTGVHIGAYGRDTAPGAPFAAGGGWSLARLVRLILDETDVPRLRLSSIEPWDLTSELLELWADARLCRHLHLPLQSGCDATLRRMNRRYTVAEFEALVKQARRLIPQVAITTDVIVGFPGETDAEFEQTRCLIERMAFSRLHVFRYSPRPGTPAAAMPDQISAPIAQARSEALIALGHRLALAYHREFVGGEIEVLLEHSPHREGTSLIWEGLTDNYVRVTVASTADLANTLARVRCTRASKESVEGVLVAPSSD